jgi:hypothetical protein
MNLPMETDEWYNDSLMLNHAVHKGKSFTNGKPGRIINACSSKIDVRKTI